MNAARTPRPRPAARYLWGALAVAAALLVAGVATLWVAGVRAAFVETGSMGPTAPVGSLIITTPPTGTVRVGEVVSFTPPVKGEPSHTHRVHQVLEDGTFTTKGDANGAADPWILHTHDLTGVATAIIPAGGYALRLLGITLTGCVILASATRLIRHRQARRIMWLAGTGLVIAAGFAIVHPIGWFQLAATTAVPGTTTAVVASTSVLPETITLLNGTHTTLGYGHTGELVTHHPGPHNLLGLWAALDLPWYGWVILWAVCAIPTLTAITLTVRERRDTRTQDTSPSRTPRTTSPQELALTS